MGWVTTVLDFLFGVAVFFVLLTWVPRLINRRIKRREQLASGDLPPSPEDEEGRSIT